MALLCSDNYPNQNEMEIFFPLQLMIFPSSQPREMLAPLSHYYSYLKNYPPRLLINGNIVGSLKLQTPQTG